jgi:hypothetical protein
MSNRIRIHQEPARGPIAFTPRRPHTRERCQPKVGEDGKAVLSEEEMRKEEKKHQKLFQNPDPDVLPHKSIGICPLCDKKNRKREYHIVGPLFVNELDPSIEKREPRISDSDRWWNKWIISYLMRPPSIESPEGFYQVIPFATCLTKSCPAFRLRTRIISCTYYRKFGRLKLFLMQISSIIGGRNQMFNPVFGRRNE